ncbi:MAG: fluoride efflux transporter CrcB [Bacteriovoracaceae bacterium]
MDFIIVGLGGFLGSICRYLIYIYFDRFQSDFPWGTLIVNVFGCFVSGLFISWASKTFPIHRQFLLFASVGFLGAFTTFSALSAQTFQLIKTNQIFLAGTNVALNFILGLISVWLGSSFKFM